MLRLLTRNTRYLARNIKKGVQAVTEKTSTEHPKQEVSSIKYIKAKDQFIKSANKDKQQSSVAELSQSERRRGRPARKIVSQQVQQPLPAMSMNGLASIRSGKKSAQNNLNEKTNTNSRSNKRQQASSEGKSNPKGIQKMDQKAIQQYESQLQEFLAQGVELRPQSEQKLKQDFILDRIMSQSNTDQMGGYFPRQNNNLKNVSLPEDYTNPGLFDSKETEDIMYMAVLKEKQLRALQQGRERDIKDITVSREEVLQKRYPKALISLAKQHRDSQLQYLRRLTEQAPENKKLISARHSPPKPRQQASFISEQTSKAITERMADIEDAVAKIDPNKMIKPTLPVVVETEQYSKKRAFRQFQISKRQELDVIIRAGEDDRIKGDKQGDALVDRLYPIATREERQMNYRQSTFGKQEDRLRKMVDRLDALGIRCLVSDLAKINKAELFREKKEREMALIWAKRMQKREKRKMMKKLTTKMHLKKLRDDLDWEKELKRIEVDSLDPDEFEEKVKASQHNRSLHQMLVEPSVNRSTLVHYQKTFLRMEHMVDSYILQSQSTAPILEAIKTIQVLSNRKNTVLNVFWDFKEYVLPRERVKLQAEIGTILNSQASFISGRMTQVLGLRYGPDIRFFRNIVSKETLQFRSQLEKNAKFLTEDMLNDYVNRNQIKPNEKQHYQQELHDFVRKQAKQLHNRPKLINKHYRKKLEAQEERKEQKRYGFVANKPKKPKKPNAVERLWKQIDGL